MKRLPFVLEVNSGHYWEKIAAFDCERPAVRYMADCAGNGLNFKYRVRKGRKIIAGEGAQ